jgi:hypothetical protein
VFITDMLPVVPAFRVALVLCPPHVFV